MNEPKNASGLGRFIPASPLGSAVAGGLLGVAAGALSVALSTEILRSYGLMLFAGVPFLMGLFSTLLYTYHAPRPLMGCIGVALLSVGMLGLVLLLVALEGLVCILMAAPFAMGAASLGSLVGYWIRARWRVRDSAFLLLLALPVLLGAEAAVLPDPPLEEVRSSIEIDAPPPQVWKHVVSFSELPPPNEWIFRTGLAYPLRADIDGRGPGAIRHCIFSTGPFVEPIEVWEEPRLLSFGVTSQPAPMVETSPYRGLHPPHVEGYFVSRRGQFLLEPLPGGRTKLEGTTWYVHKIWPAFYWKWWSDAIIHRIHLRVLRHVKALSERRDP
jgi:hypothetical protein